MEVGVLDAAVRACATLLLYACAVCTAVVVMPFSIPLSLLFFFFVLALVVCRCGRMGVGEAVES